MSTHVRRTLEVAVAVIVAAYTTALQTPVVVTWLDHHPADAAVVSLGAGVLVAAYKAARDKLRAQPDTSTVSGSSMGAK